jgi:hypothetical protein
VPDPATQVRADDEPVSLHFTERLSEHFLGRHREHSSQLAQPRGSSLEAVEDSDFPLSLNERDCELNRLVFLGRALMTKSRSAFLFLPLGISMSNGYGFPDRVRHNFVVFLV